MCHPYIESVTALSDIVLHYFLFQLLRVCFSSIRLKVLLHNYLAVNTVPKSIQLSNYRKNIFHWYAATPSVDISYRGW